MSQNLRNYHHHSLPIQRILFYSQFPTLFFVSVQGNDKLGLIFEMMNHFLFGKNGSRFQVIKLYIYIYIYIYCVCERKTLIDVTCSWMIWKDTLYMGTEKTNQVRCTLVSCSIIFKIPFFVCSNFSY